MAKKSMLQRELKRKNLVKHYLEKRKEILKQLKNVTSLEEIFLLNEKLQKLPKNSSPIRLRNRCWKTGKPRGYSRFFGLCRNAVRELAHDCFLPGVTKASW
uniref:Small ribosomal subunit protein uS14c n=1 Tax=Synura uvella TaxID=52557 RepID=A0A3G2QZC1_9STRA|nr:ribosomal protein S14 [Synura uvella]AYO28332.1 ribosomal protein S14 [Synura uvella]